MSRESKEILSGTLVLGVVCVLLIMAGAAVTGEREPLEIVFVARGMAFIGPDGATNPTITVPLGKPVRFLVRNEDNGMEHDLEVSRGSGRSPVRTPTLNLGETAILLVTFTEPGEESYLCTFHAGMMRGTIRVVR